MAEVPEVKLLMTLTVVFVVGTFVFVVAFRAMALFKNLQQGINPLSDNSTTRVAVKETKLLKVVPWALGGLYLTLVGAIAYYMYKKYGGRGGAGISEEEINEFGKTLRK